MVRHSEAISRPEGMAAMGKIPKPRGARETTAEPKALPPRDRPRSLKVRTLFLSDIHLGTRSLKVETLLSFLDHITAERIFLVGDIVDLWKLGGRLYWPPGHNEVLHRFFELARRGVEVVYIPGNHDAAFRQHLDLCFCGIRIERDAWVELGTGRRLLVIHGDELDPEIRPKGWRAWFGDRLYAASLLLDLGCDRLRRLFGQRDHWSLAGYLKRRAAPAERVIQTFEAAAKDYARARGATGILCGHIHRPALDRSDDCLYANCGDWIESCTALVETAMGELELIRWRTTLRRPRAAEAPLDLPRELLERSFVLG